VSNVNADEFGAGACRHTGGPANKLPGRLASGDRDHQALPSFPGVRDLVAFTVGLKFVVDPIREPEQGQFSESREVALAKEVGESGVHSLGRVDVPVGHTSPQGFGGDVD
jgi:hypothetical protein